MKVTGIVYNSEDRIQLAQDGILTATKPNHVKLSAAIGISFEVNKLRRLLSWYYCIYFLRTSRVRFPAVNGFSLLHSVQTGSWANPASYSVKRPGHEADHSPLSSAEVKNGGDKLQLPHMSSWHSAQQIKHRQKFNFFILIY
jgi:hypothetical protein